LYSYDAANRLTSVTGGTGNSSSFAYDGDGNRVSQVVGKGTYSYVNDVATAVPVVLQESGPGGNISYAYGSRLISETSSSFDYSYLYDGLGSVMGLTDNANSHLGERYDYDAWGNTVFTVPANAVGTENKFGFAGQAVDPGTGLYFLRARYYDPTTGRLLSKTPYPELPDFR
jgi:RHS repeat-associated protein